MCCKDPPPNFYLLGPPPKPPWLSYNLHCGQDGLVLQHEAQNSALPNSSGGGFASSTLNVVAVVLFCLASLFLILTLLVLWNRRRILQKQQVKHDDSPDEHQFLYNYKIRGKLWKIPRVTMVLRSKLQNKNDAKLQTKEEEIKENISNLPMYNSSRLSKTDTIDTGYGGELSMTNLHNISEDNDIETNRSSMGSCYRFQHSQHKPCSSLERGSSTTSGFSSEGEGQYQEEPIQHLQLGYTNRTRRVKRKGRRARRPEEDGELGDAEGSLECLNEKRDLKEHSGPKGKPPRSRVPSTEDDVLYIKHHQPDTRNSSNSIKKPVSSVIHKVQMSIPRCKHKTQEFKLSAPKILNSGSQHETKKKDEVDKRKDVLKGLAKPSSDPINLVPSIGKRVDDSSKIRKKRKKNGTSGNDGILVQQQRHSNSIETSDNISNEIIESYA